MNELQVFKNDNFGEIRTVYQNNEIFFVAADICKSLELGQVTNSLRRLANDEKALISIKGISRGNDKVNVINEAGLYNLVLASRKLEAKAFKRWITHDVIPSIRKTGKYAVTTSSPAAADKDGVKYYHCVPVITKKELAQALGMEVGALQYYISKLNLLDKGTDYFLISGKDLFAFKHKYNMSNLCTSLMLITEKGAIKIYERLQKEYSPVIFEEKALAIPKPQHNTAPVDENRLYADIPGCKEIQEKIKLVKRSITALEELLEEYNGWNKKDKTEHLFHAMNHVGIMLYCRITDIGRSKYNLIPDPYLYPPDK